MKELPRILVDGQAAVTIAGNFDNQLTVVGSFTDDNTALYKKITWLHYGDEANFKHTVFRDIDMIVSIENMEHIDEIAALAIQHRKCLLCFADKVESQHNKALLEAAHYVPVALYITHNEKIGNCVNLIAYIAKHLPSASAKGEIYDEKDILELTSKE